MFTKSSFRPSDTGIAAVYIKLNKNIQQQKQKQIHIMGTDLENATRLCNLDTLSIALSKLQGFPLKSASYLESKKGNPGKQLDWHLLKKAFN